VTTVFSRFRRLAWTVHYLEGRQIGGQIRHRVVGSLQRHANREERAVVGNFGCAWPTYVRFLPPGVQDNRGDAIRDGVLRFLNAEALLGFPPRWECPDLPKLWQYNLHYFEWLWALDYQEARSVALDWIEKHRLARGAVGWDAYPTCLRLVNWCAVFFGRLREETEADRAFRERLCGSIVRQVDWLQRHLETHLLGNHYLENGAALAFVGSCFKGEKAGQWFDRGWRILSEQIPEQVSADGMHFELSPMYHCRVMYVLAMLMATGNKKLQDIVAQPLSRMRKALDCLCHPDGGIALLNDSAFGIYSEPTELRRFCKELRGVCSAMPATVQGNFALPDAGYYGWRDAGGNYLLCDFGRIGPDYIPGHAHADIFSFELSLRGRRVIVDAGVHDYEVSETRRYCRSTAAHNTVEIDGQDQCEMWGAFRVARRGYPYNVLFGQTEDGFELSGWHDGYSRLPGKPIHYRTIRWLASEGLVIYDRIAGSRVVHAVSRIHLHPQCSVIDSKDGVVIVASPEGHFQIVATQCAEVKLERGWYCPGFGCRYASDVICLSGRGKDIHIGYHVTVLKGL